MVHNERKWDELLRIRTSGWDWSNADSHHFPYEPTDYAVLERLAGSGYIKKHNTVLDYGCGKGRVEFFLSHQTKCKTIGVEYDDRLFLSAMNNLERAVSKHKVAVCLECAEDYKVPTKVDVCYFFNPFSVDILKSVMARIMESYYIKPRDILLMFYYPSDAYMSYLMTNNNLLFVDEIYCMDLYEEENDRERIVIFQVV